MQEILQHIAQFWLNYLVIMSPFLFAVFAVWFSEKSYLPHEDPDHPDHPAHPHHWWNRIE